MALKQLELQLLHAKLADSTIQNYLAEWNKYVSFCNDRNLNVIHWEELLPLYLAWMFANKRGASAGKAFYAVKHVLMLNGITVQKNAKLSALLSSIHTNWNLMDRVPLERTAFQLQHLRAFVEKYGTQGNFGRMAAVVAIGFRLALRPSELGSISRADVCFTDKGATIALHARKTNQGGKETNEPIDGTDSVICPIKLLKSWMLQTVHVPIEFPLFGSSECDSEPISGEEVSKIVKLISPDSMVGGHSLRIGAATTAAEQGVSTEIIQALGNWKSDAYRRYIRTVGAAANGLSKQLGF